MHSYLSYFVCLHCYKEYSPLQCLGTKQILISSGTIDPTFWTLLITVVSKDFWALVASTPNSWNIQLPIVGTFYLTIGRIANYWKNSTTKMNESPNCWNIHFFSLPAKSWSFGLNFWNISVNFLVDLAKLR